MAGILYRVTHLVSKYGMSFVFVFDGPPPRLKQEEIEKRRRLREKATREWKEALSAGNYEKAFSKAVMMNRLTGPMVQDAKKLLALLGVPLVQAPSEAESQAAYMAVKGDVWGASSKDYDSLLFGAPRLVRYLTIYGREYLPSKGVSRPLTPELIVLSEFLSKHGISRSQLVDMAILVGTDFNRGIKGVGPKTALKLIKEHGRLEDLPVDVRSKVDGRYEEVRGIFLKPEVTSDYDARGASLREDELYRFLCDEKGFSRVRVENAVNRMKEAHKEREQPDLGKWL